MMPPVTSLPTGSEKRTSGRIVDCLLRSVCATCLWMGIMALSSCATGPQGPPLPDVQDHVQQTRERLERTLAERQAIESQLVELRLTMLELDAPSRDLFAPPFPNDLFRHIAVECLNTPSTQTEDPSAERPSFSLPNSNGESRKHRLTCRPPYLSRLLEQLEASTPAQRTSMLQLLVQLDRFYQIRTSLREALDRLPEDVSQHREYLAEQRAEIRRIRTRLEARKPEYTRSRWQRVGERLEGWRAHLRSLDMLADELERFSDTWSLQVRALNKTAYFLVTSEWRPE